MGKDMAHVFAERTFRSFYDQNSKKVFSDLEFCQCHFISSRISMTRKPHRRSTVRNVKIIDCEQNGCSLDTAIVEDVMVDGLKTNGIFHSWGAVFKHVVLKGKVGSIMFSPIVSTGMAKPSQQKAFDEANAQYYSGVDWALDIREAEFEEADLRGVPGGLILRDPETQFLMTKQEVLKGNWKKVNLSGTYWQTSIEFFLSSIYEETVLVAPKLDRNYRFLLDKLLELKDVGLFN